MSRRWLLGLAVGLLWMLTACSGARPRVATSLEALRREAPSSGDPELVGRWLLGELVSPGGSAERARAARQRLEQLGGKGWQASLARALDDTWHGDLPRAPEHWLDTVIAARASEERAAPFVGWLASLRAAQLQHEAPGSFERWKPRVQDLLDQPGRLGWRARGELTAWWLAQHSRRAPADLQAEAVARWGCVTELALAGPFGRGTPADAIGSFAAEAPAPWPAAFPRDPVRGTTPRVLRVRRQGCRTYADEPVRPGVFYVQTFFELREPEELIVSVQGALAVWIDDHRVLRRDPRDWAVWPRFGVRVRLDAGRHRLLARVSEPVGVVRLMHTDGSPARVLASTDGGPPHSLSPPEIGPDPNLLSGLVRDGDVRDPGDDLLRYVAAQLALHESQADLATLLLEPLVRDPERSTAPMLAFAAELVGADPIFDENQARDLRRALQEKAVQRDPGLWAARLGLLGWKAQTASPAEAVAEARELLRAFPRVPAVASTLARLYGELGWTAEQERVLLDMVRSFPESPDALAGAIEILEARGEHRQADELTARLLELDPDSDIRVVRALARQDHAAALAELQRLVERRPDQEGLLARLREVTLARGDASAGMELLERALAAAPRDAARRLALADARLAAGDRSALRRALVEAFSVGASTRELEVALDLVEGTTELEAHRIPARQAIREYEARGVQLPGTAARVLDYAVIWVHADGSSRMLEHEIIHLQSDEAIKAYAERQRPEGLVFHLRVIKRDGRILEPEVVAGKPTVTMPHLEVGDYVETERLVTTSSESEGGRVWIGPQWFFREEKVGYARSELRVITPTDKPLLIETQGQVPEPTVRQDGALTIRTWRVDFSPAAPTEPFSVPPREFLPSVRLAWGISLEERLQRLADQLLDLTPIDPRIRRIATRIVAGVPAADDRERAARLYRWVLENVEEGEQTDGRKVVVGKNGSRWRAFATLCRSLGLRVDVALARDRLARPDQGPISRATSFTEPVLRLATRPDPVWLTVGDRYLPFGYIPAGIRGAPAWLLADGKPAPARVPEGGSADGTRWSGHLDLMPGGDAQGTLTLVVSGAPAAQYRKAFAQLPSGQLADVLESRLLGRALRGARLERYRVLALDQLDLPLELSLSTRIASLAHPEGAGVVIEPPFQLRLATLAALPSRQTPLLIGEVLHQEVRVVIALPAGARAAGLPPPRTYAWRDHRVELRDRLEGNTLVFDRVFHLAAGRISPEDYPAFAAFAREVDERSGAAVRVTLP